jgi:hypothetical protein
LLSYFALTRNRRKSRRSKLLCSASLHSVIFSNRLRRPFPRVKTPPQNRDKKARPRLYVKSLCQKENTVIIPKSITLLLRYKHSYSGVPAARVFNIFPQTVTPAFLAPPFPAHKSHSPQRRKKPRHPALGKALPFPRNREAPWELSVLSPPGAAQPSRLSYSGGSTPGFPLPPPPPVKVSD